MRPAEVAPPSAADVKATLPEPRKSACPPALPDEPSRPKLRNRRRIATLSVVRKRVKKARSADHSRVPHRGHLPQFTARSDAAPLPHYTFPRVARRRLLHASVSPASIRRLTLYLRHLDALAGDSQSRTISSRELGDALGLTDAQVRKDLSRFGTFGSPGIGYRVDQLAMRLRHLIGTDRAWPTILVGAGNLGRALASHAGFSAKGFELVAAFDRDPFRVGQSLTERGPVVRDIGELDAFVRASNAKLAILAVPAAAAQPLADVLVAAGITGLLNFAPVHLEVPEHVTVNSVDLAGQLEQIVFHLDLPRALSRA